MVGCRRQWGRCIASCRKRGKDLVLSPLLFWVNFLEVDDERWGVAQDFRVQAILKKFGIVGKGVESGAVH